jgi:putative transposase
VKSGYSVKRVCEVLSISRSSYYQWIKQREKRSIHTEGNSSLVAKIQEIKELHPFWGYRRVWAWLNHREKIIISQRKVRKLFKEHGFGVEIKHYKAKRTPQRAKPKATRPNQYWGIDMAKVMVQGIGWVYLILVLDWYTRKIVGYHLSLRCKTQDWKVAIHQAINQEFPEGVRGAGLCLISDNGSQPTSNAFIQEMNLLEIKQIFTSYNNPKGNAETERMIRTLKEEVVWLNEFNTVKEAKEAISSWIETEYNLRYVHSQLGYQSPVEFEKLYYEGQDKDAA